MKKILFLSTILLLGLAACTPPHRPVTGVRMSCPRFALTAGSTERALTVTVLPQNASNRNVTWTSSDSTIVSVDTYGVLTAHSVGTATITVTTEDGDFTASCDISVEPYISASLDGVVINGVRWATRNVGAPGTFAERPRDAGMFYQWNRRQGWAATGNVTDWNSENEAGTEWERANDPCPEGWRVPTYAELRSLLDAGSVWTTIREVNGRVFGDAPNQIFLRAAGWREEHNGVLEHAPGIGFYWSNAAVAGQMAVHLHFSIPIIPPGVMIHRRARALPIRCVAES